jgi:hypothetical protein
VPEVPKYMMIYRGEATDLADLSEEEAAAVLEKWRSWMDRVGPSLVDLGAPFGGGTAVIDDGTSGPASSLAGYSIVEAGDLSHAAALADGHPFLSEGQGDYAIEVFELMPVPFES